ncbi:hypothetical protein ES332_D12G188500v1 [Gossypium tomentosum]|uniref:Ubiquitinyl hydrolase variant UBP zinc finger domain-containing protein n=1 Tax=Gossypium tomentosum TaxID=34277 RepID=A0A5D2IAG0_GOSTO|nr:hypothetical protein ES332_D12G188500v1 [Gossypium tomentosum]
MFFTNLSRVRIPKPTNRIYKQECCLSFDSPHKPKSCEFQAHKGVRIKVHYQLLLFLMA